MNVYLAHLLCVLALATAGWIARTRPGLSRRAMLAALPPAAVAASLLWFHSEPARLFSDFHKAYRPAGEAAWADGGQLLALYQPAHFVNIPIVALLFSPFAVLPAGAAGILFLAMGVVAVALVGIHLVRATKGELPVRAIVVVALLAASGPLFNSLREGNSTHLLFLLLLPAAGFLGHGREVPAGILLALVALLKLPFGLFALYLLVTRRWKALAAFAATLAVLLSLSLAIYGWPLHEAWYSHCIKPFQRRPIAAFNAQSLGGTLARLMTTGHLFDWEPIRRPPMFGTFKTILTIPLFAIPFLAILLARHPRTPARVAAELAAVMALAILVSPLSWSHYYLLLVWPAAMLLTGTWPLPRNPGVRVLLFASVLLVSLPVIVAIPANAALADFYKRVFLSHFFAGGVMMLGLLATSLWLGEGTRLAEGEADEST